MSDEALIDVIILALDRVDVTKEAIRSALEQEGVPVKVWVLDQGSKPEELADLKAYCEGKDRLHLEIGTENLGVAGGRNKASQMGSAKYIVALDNDAEFVDVHQLKKVADVMEGDPDLGAIGIKIINYFSRDNDKLSWGYPKSLEPKWEQPFLTTRFIGAGHCIRRELFEKVGQYDDRLFFAWEEYDLSCRLINLGKKIKYVPDIAIYHKVSPDKRVNWEDGRYYFHVRNRLYIYLKYGLSWPAFYGIAAAYLAKGVYNGVGDQVMKGVRDAVKQYGDFRKNDPYQEYYKLSDAAKAYIQEHDIAYRGSVLNRVKKEVFSKLPGEEKSPSPNGSGA